MAKTNNRVSSVPANETKEQRSLRLALQRMPKALKYIKLVGNLATNNYSFTEAQRNKIVKDLKQAVAVVETAFADRVEEGAAEEYTL